MPKTVHLPRVPTCHPDDDDPSLPWKSRQRDGIDVTWTRTSQRLDFGGWYDGAVGIEGDSLSLREFFDLLGITEKDCLRAFGSP